VITFTVVFEIRVIGRWREVKGADAARIPKILAITLPPSHELKDENEIKLHFAGCIRRSL